MKKMRIVAYVLIVALVVILIRPEIIGNDGFTRLIRGETSDTTKVPESTKPSNPSDGGTSNSNPDEDRNPTSSAPSEEDTNPNAPEESGDENSDFIPDYDFPFELPLNGATGYASIAMDLVSEPNPGGNILKTLQPGTSFCIVEEVDKTWWKVTVEGETGYLKSVFCMLNLVDVIPSIVYYNSNSTFSLYRTSGLDIPEITGEVLYDVSGQNDRLGEYTYNMPILYGMAKKVMEAQKAALADGYSLKIYETYRPYKTQMEVCTALSEMIEICGGDVKKAVNNGTWGLNWFIATGRSNHQRGYAMDVSLVKILETQVRTCGQYKYLKVTDYMEEEMPTQMHELSVAAVSLSVPVDSNSTTAWQGVQVSETMNESAMLLRNYCTLAGLTPLASEWWHFNDLGAKAAVKDNYSLGDYELDNNCSRVPE